MFVCRSLVLLCCVLLNLYSTNLEKNRLFIYLNLFVWPFGILVTAITYAKPRSFSINYNENYLLSAGCQPDFKFEVSADGLDCLLVHEAYVLVISYYGIESVLVISSQMVFCLIIYRAYSQYELKAQLAQRSNELDQDISSHQIKVEQSYAVLMGSIPFSITSIIYIIVYIPVLTKQFVFIYKGPIEDHPGLEAFLTLWFLCAGNFTSLMNIIFYGIMCKVMRKEVTKGAKSKYHKLRYGARRLRRVSTSFWSVTARVKDDTNLTTNSSPKSDGSFFNEEEEFVSSVETLS